MVSSIFSIDVSLRNSDLSHGSNYNPQLKTAGPISPAQFFHACIGCIALCPANTSPQISHINSNLLSFSACPFRPTMLSPLTFPVSLPLTKLIQKPRTNLCSFLFYILPFIQASLIYRPKYLSNHSVFSPCSHPTPEEYLIFRLY